MMRAVWATLLAATLAAALPACTRTGAHEADRSVAIAASAGDAPSQRAWVNVAALLHAPAFSAMLAPYGREVAALRSTLTQPNGARNGETIASDALQLRSELDRTAARLEALSRVRAVTDAHQRAGLASLLALMPGTNGAPAVATEVQRAYLLQRKAVRSAAPAALLRFRRALLARERRALTSLQRAILARTHAALAARRQQLDENEAELEMKIARRQARQRFMLRTQLQDLVLSAGNRARLQGELQALDGSRAAALTQQRQRDRATLAAVRSRLAARAIAAYARAAAEIHVRTMADLAAMSRAVRTQETMASRPPLNLALGASQGLSMRTAGERLRAEEDRRFRRSTTNSSAAFARARADLSTAMTQARDASAANRRSVEAQIGALERDRRLLRNEIVALILRDAAREAHARGLAAPVSRAGRAPRNSVDLTAVVSKDLTSL